MAVSNAPGTDSFVFDWSFVQYNRDGTTYQTAFRSQQEFVLKCISPGAGFAASEDLEFFV